MKSRLVKGVFGIFQTLKTYGASLIVDSSITVNGLTAGGVTVLLRDGSGNILWATGATVPVDTTVGYAQGGLFVDSDTAAGTGSLYINKGTAATAEFSLVTQAA